LLTNLGYKGVNMSISPVPPVNAAIKTGTIKATDESIKETKKPISNDNSLDAETKHVLDHASGLLQTIITDKLSDKVIRKMPSDEYLHLLSLLDEIISGSIDKHV
jgi:uncharacterized FlaG/YvyC family protein